MLATSTSLSAAWKPFPHLLMCPPSKTPLLFSWFGDCFLFFVVP